MKPYVELTTVPTADICPCVDRKCVIIEESEVPKRTRNTVSNTVIMASYAVRYQPLNAIIVKQTASAVRHIMRVESADAMK